MFKARDWVFFLGILLMHWTLLRPSPSDAIFMLALLLSVLCNPPLNARFSVFYFLLLTWIGCVFVSSIHVMSEPDVRFQLLAHGFVVLLSFAGLLIGFSWSEGDFVRLLKVWVVSASIAASLGLYGFATGDETFLWDGRAKGLFDEPIAFGAFLMPGLYGSMYLISHQQKKLLPIAAFALCTVGVLLSFSRAVIFALVVFTPVYFLTLNRLNLKRALAYLIIGVFVLGALFGVAFALSDEFGAKVLDRMTLAKSYDSERGGRFDRYLESIPMILDHPGGVGMLQIDKVFSEPVHDIYLSSFLNYGWLAGVAFILFTVLSFHVAIQNYKLTHSPLAVWLSFSLLAQFPCAVVQQVEHWRHLWLLFGLLWSFGSRRFLRTQPAAPVQRPTEAGFVQLRHG